MGGWLCLGRVVLECVCAGCVCLADVIALLVQNRPPATESPSNNRNALPIDRESLIFGGFARIRRVFLSWEGGTILGGCFCVGKAEWSGWGDSS